MKTILFQGDSITDCGRIREERGNNVIGYALKIWDKCRKATDFGDGYPAMVKAELQNTAPGQYNFYNRGVGGDRILEVYARIVKDIINLKPDYMSLLIGVNDVWQGIDWKNATGVARYEKVYDIFLTELKEELPDLKIIIFEPFVLEGTATSNNEKQPDKYRIFRSGVEEMAAIAKKLAEKHGIKFVELQSMFDKAAETIPAKDLLADGVHPTAKGHELIKNEWIKAFNEIK